MGRSTSLCSLHLCVLRRIGVPTQAAAEEQQTDGQANPHIGPGGEYQSVELSSDPWRYTGRRSGCLFLLSEKLVQTAVSLFRGTDPNKIVSPCKQGTIPAQHRLSQQ